MEQNVTKDIAILVLGAVAGVLPWILDKLGVEMPKSIYIGLLYLATLLIWWSLANLQWLDHLSFFQTKQVSSGQIVLGFLAGAVLCLITVHIFDFGEDSLTKFKNAKFETVKDRVFIDEVVPLDNHEYVRCIFTNVTFSYYGRSPIKFIGNTVNGDPHFQLGSGPVVNFVIMMKVAKLLAPGREIRKERTTILFAWIRPHPVLWLLDVCIRGSGSRLA